MFYTLQSLATQESENIGPSGLLGHFVQRHHLRLDPCFPPTVVLVVFGLAREKLQTTLVLTCSGTHGGAEFLLGASTVLAEAPLPMSKHR